MADESNPGDTSVSQFLTVLIPNLIVFAVFVLLFQFFRKKQRRVYEPRSVVESVGTDLRPEEAPKGFLRWVPFLWGKPGSYMLQQTGPDGFYFLRYLYIFSSICLGGCFLLWPILFPVNATNSNHEEGLNTISYANVRGKWRFLAHVFLSWVFFGISLFVIYRELVHYVTFRHVLQTTPLYDSLLSSRTLLLTEVPEKYLETEELKSQFPTADHIWFARDYKKLQDKVKERKKLANKYEGALNKVLKKAVKMRNKALKKGKEPPTPANDVDKYLKDGKKRPTHRLKFLIGKKVDTLDYGVVHIGELNTEITESQKEMDQYDKVNSVFIGFPSQIELQKAYQAIPYHDELKVARRFSGISPDDVVWDNLSLSTHKRWVKKLIATTILTLTVMFWCIPVAVVGAISNINLLTDKVPFLRFINNMPDWLMGVITGLLPVIALAVLMSLVPPFIKFMGKFGGCLTAQHIDSFCQDWYYAFQVINSFLIITCTSAAASSVTSIVRKPASALELLANKLPKASNFYISYYCLYGLSVSSGALLQIVALILAQFLGKILDSTPRAKWNRWNILGQPGWGVIYPGFSLLVVIAYAYAIIAPLILGFAFVTMILIYLAFMYNLNYVYQPALMDSRGRNYISSLFQLFVAIYLSEVILIAMFVFGKNWVSVALEAVALGVTALVHIYLKWRFLPLMDTVPLSAIKYAAGDTTFQYPMHDQGLSEVKNEGQNYWAGGNKLGLTSSHHHDHVLTNGNENANLLKDEKYTAEKSSTEKSGEESSKNKSAADSNSSREKFGIDLESEGSKSRRVETKRQVLSTKPKGSFKYWIKRFFNPKLESFDDVRDLMPDNYFNYIEYNSEFMKTAYDDPCINEDVPHIWIARDEMGLSEIEKEKALKNGVDVSNENATFDEKGELIFTGPPPSYEESLKL